MIAVADGGLNCKRQWQFKDALLVNFAVLFAGVLILNREGWVVPSNNEYIYLIGLAKAWNPQLLSNDWTFSEPSSTHFVFNLLFGPLTLVLPLETVGWVGRVISWSLILAALLLLGRHFKIPLWTMTSAILLWLFYRQSIVAGEWVFGTFEAKGIAYALLFFSLNGFMQQKLVWPSVLLGLAFSFHPLVGFWGALAAGLSLVALRWPLEAIVKFTFYTAVFALPGLMPLLMAPSESGPEFTEALKFVTLVVMPYHFDPFYFASSKRLLLLLILLLGFNWLHARSQIHSHAVRFLISFQMFLGFFFLVSFLARYLEKYELLVAMPGRLFPVLLPLFFFFHFMSAWRYFFLTRAGKVFVLSGFLAVATFGNPVAIFADHLKKHYDMWTREDEDWAKALKWTAANTPPQAIVIAPPWRGETFYLSRRAQIANWWFPRFDRLAEWRERLESVVGDLGAVEPQTTRARVESMEAHFAQLTASDIARLAEKYGAEYLVSSASYGYPVLFNTGRYRVYGLAKKGRLESPVDG